MVSTITYYNQLLLLLIGCSEGSVRLVGPNVNVTRYGRLEICGSSGLWYSVCADGSFCSLTAKVICRQLGLSTTGKHAQPVWVSNVIPED